MAAGRWSVFQGMLNNHAGSGEEGSAAHCFVLSHPFKVPFLSFFFSSCCLSSSGSRVFGRGCGGDYEFCQAEQG